MATARTKIILAYARWTALSALRSGAPIKSRIDVYSLLDKVRFDVVLDGRSRLASKTFDSWHEEQATELCRRDRRVSLGWSSKLINVYLKTAAYVGDLGRPGLREAIHPPIDASLWKGIRIKFRGRDDILDKVCCVRRIKDITDYSTYRRIIDGCRDAAKSLGCSLIEVEQLWCGSATPGR